LPNLPASDFSFIFLYQIIFYVSSKKFSKPSQKIKASIAPGHMRSIVFVHKTKNRPVIWPWAFWTPKGEGRFTGVIISLEL
jgi:hypothetical protein